MDAILAVLLVLTRIFLLPYSEYNRSNHHNFLLWIRDQFEFYNDKRKRKPFINLWRERADTRLKESRTKRGAEREVYFKKSRAYSKMAAAQTYAMHNKVQYRNVCDLSDLTRSEAHEYLYRFLSAERDNVERVFVEIACESPYNSDQTLIDLRESIKQAIERDFMQTKFYIEPCHDNIESKYTFHIDLIEPSRFAKIIDFLVRFGVFCSAELDLSMVALFMSTILGLGGLYALVIEGGKAYHIYDINH